MPEDAASSDVEDDVACNELDGPKTGGTRPGRDKIPGGECRRTGEARWPDTCLRSGMESE